MAPMRLHCQHCLPHWGLMHDVNSGLIGVMPKKRDSHLQLFSGTPPIAYVRHSFRPCWPWLKIKQRETARFQGWHRWAKSQLTNDDPDGLWPRGSTAPPGGGNHQAGSNEKKEAGTARGLANPASRSLFFKTNALFITFPMPVDPP